VGNTDTQKGLCHSNDAMMKKEEIYWKKHNFSDASIIFIIPLGRYTTYTAAYSNRLYRK